MVLHQVLQGGIVARGKLIQHILVGRPGRHRDHGLQVRRQGLERILVDDKFQHGAGLVPAGIVVIFRHLVQAQGEIVVGAHPFRRIDHASLQRGVELSARYAYRRAAGLGKHIARQAGNTHFQALQVGNGIDFPVEPAGHLHTGIAAGERDDIERGIGLAPQFQAAAVM